MPGKTLYLCYFGIREPLVQTQVLPYIREIIAGGATFTLLTFEPEGRDESDFSKLKTQLAEEGIEWHHLRYHKNPSVPATAYDVVRGTIFTWKYLRDNRVDLIHGRVHIPHLMGALARKFSRQKPKLLFDIRGFFPEEYTDAGRWPENGWLYRTVKRVERWLLKESDGFVILTEKAREILFSGDALGERPVEVIPCCVDFASRFAIDQNEKRTEMRAKLAVENRLVLVHSGALGGLYLTEHIANLLAAARERDPSAFAMFLTQSNPEIILPRLRERGFSDADYFAQMVAADQVPQYLCAADVSISFVKAGYATQSRSPTKIPEYLACGLPVIANRGVGDVDALIEDEKVGVLIDEFNRDAYRYALNEIEKLVTGPYFQERCRAAAINRFDLKSIGGVRYRRLYEAVLSDTEPPGPTAGGLR